MQFATVMGRGSVGNPSTGGGRGRGGSVLGWGVVGWIVPAVFGRVSERVSGVDSGNGR